MCLPGWVRVWRDDVCVTRMKTFQAGKRFLREIHSLATDIETPSLIIFHCIKLCYTHVCFLTFATQESKTFLHKQMHALCRAEAIMTCQPPRMTRNYRWSNVFHWRMSRPWVEYLKKGYNQRLNNNPLSVQPSWKWPLAHSACSQHTSPLYCTSKQTNKNTLWERNDLSD